MATRFADRKRSNSEKFIDACLGSHGASKKDFTADNFIAIWKRYDKDGNKYLEKRELDQFLGDFLKSSLGDGNSRKISPKELSTLKEQLLEEFDQNQDGKIRLKEVATLLSAQESFFLLFRLDNGPEKGVDYMKIWKKYDRDLSGYIEADELKVFLRELITGANRHNNIDEERLDSYTRTIMDLFDSNKDGKLGFSELAGMLPANENCVQRIVEKVINVKTLTQADVRGILNGYDQDGSGTLEGSELINLAKDILEISQPGKAYSAQEVEDLADSMLTGCDINQDGSVDARELLLIIGAVINVAADKADTELAENFHRQIMNSYKAQYILSYIPNDY